MAILDEAVTTARFTGLSGLTIGTLAERTGLSKSGLYAHFKSKETLQLATMAHNREQFVSEVMRPALTAARGEKRLRALIENWMRWCEHPGVCLFQSAANEFGDRSGPLHDQMMADEHDLLDSIGQILGTLISSGDIRPDTDITQISLEVLGALAGYKWMRRVLHEPTAAQRTWTAVDRILDSLRP
ncbi:MAG: TetR/AcrR family transcriptional regulator [Stackebrandtia sp.]